MPDRPPKPVAPVEVTNTDPIPVVVAPPPEPNVLTGQARANVDARILRTEGQRHTSNIWERTQQVIALSVVESALLVIVFIVFRGDKAEVQLAMTVLFGMVNLVIGFYFGRTNHQRVGGVGGDEVPGGR